MTCRETARRVPTRHLGRSVAPLLLAAGTVSAQTAGVERAFAVLPTVSVTETLTNNALLSSVDKRTDAVTQLTAGISLMARGGRTNASLDYQLSGSIHAKSTAANNTANTLRAALAVELVSNFLFIDANASIGQQTISAFGTQTTDLAVDNSNRTEVRGFTISPSVRGRIGSLATYSARFTHAQESSASTTVGDTTSDNALVSLNSAGSSVLGWGLSGSRQRSEFSAGRATTTDSLRAALNYTANPELRLTLDGGRESSNVIVSGDENTRTWGVGLDWTPSERTRLTARRERRFFGDAHSLSFDHRTGRTLWRFSSNKDISTGTSNNTATGNTSAYELIYASLATLYPDPILRQQMTLLQLAQRGLSPNSLVSTGFLKSAATLVNKQDLSVVLQGVRTTATLSLSRSDSRRLDNVSTAQDDLSASENIRQSGITVTLGHRLTPTAGLSLTLSKLRTRGDLASQATDLQSLNLSWTGQIGLRSSLSFGARRVEFDSPSAPYDESAVFATLSMQF